MAKKNLIRIIACLLLVSGLGLLAVGCWIPAKAELANILLSRAWEESRRTRQPVRPWPWADTWPVGRLRCSHLGVSSIILEGESGSSLAFGPGHFLRSGKIGGSTHVILAGHRDTSFRFLEDLQPGDVLMLEGKTRQQRYRIDDIAIIPARDLMLDPSVSGRLTLITCYPFHTLRSNTPLRYVVTAIALPLDV